MIEEINLNLIPNGVSPVCHVSQYDEGRQIKINLFEGINPYTIQSGDTFTLNVRKPDNTIITKSVTGTQGNNYIIISTTQQIAAVVGNNLCEIKITNGSTVIGTLNFIMQVERDVLADGTPSQSDIEDLDARIQEVIEDNYYNKSEIDAALALKANSDDVLPINDIVYDDETIETEINFSNVGLLKYTDGTIEALETAFKTTDYIDITDLIGIYRTGTTTMFTLWRYAFYDENKNFIGIVEDTTDYEIVPYDNKQVTWLDLDAFNNAKFVRISWAIVRPYTYYTVKTIPVFSYYDIPRIKINGIDPLKFYGKKIVNFGDSIFGNYRDTNETTDKSISKMIEEATGATCYNCGFGGCRMSIHSNYWDAFSMYRLADAITTGDWTEQDAAIAASPAGMPAYFAETLALLKTINFNKIDYITIGYGTNDYSGNVFITGQEATFAHEYDYFMGALRYSIRKILNTYPNIRIIVISPCWRWFLENGVYAYSSDDNESKNTRNYILPDYVNACKQVCDEYHIEYIDTYTTLGFNEFTHLAYFPSNDGTHPNQNGRQLRADRIVGQMNALN